MVAGTLYTYPENFRAYKALIAAKYSSADVKVASNFVFGETNKTEEFLKKFPSGKVPAFESTDGKCLQDSNAIAYYVANDQLRGKSDFEKSQVLQWIFFAETEILPASCAWVFPVLGIIQFEKKVFERSKEDVKSALNILDAHLLTRTYLVGERVSLADIVVACTLLHLYTHVLDPEFRKPFVNTNRWFTTVINQSQFKEVAGEVKFCEKVAEVDHKKFQQLQQQQQVKGKEKKAPKEEKKIPAKKEKKQQEKEPEEELDAADAALAAEPKSKDPWESLPKGTFVMDDFKRVYSNESEEKSIPYFWEKFDPENYSIWKGEYKYNNELTKVFMSCNLITGMFQRLDKMRKNAFASVCLFGTDNDSTISGIWVWRGQDLAFNLSPDWQIDYESYAWTKLDPKSEETKKLVEQYFSWTGADKDGRKFNQGKIFK
ncbi:elongation factor 1-gamma [Agrilus planipennis]|uniref:Elongation factor 1-gamma n=1 Tax=Agrilus planipennis TaxID=224129 RepID=A0A1W4W770_AGRPL|nr:elongation factor 1-gamma [Agrilus planipennis]